MTPLQNLRITDDISDNLGPSATFNMFYESGPTVNALSFPVTFPFCVFQDLSNRRVEQPINGLIAEDSSVVNADNTDNVDIREYASPISLFH